MTANVPTLDLARCALLLDIDGTLAPIVEDPAAARVPPATLALVEAAVDACLLVGVVSGRSLDDARRMVPVDGIWRAASHGMAIEAPDGVVDTDPVAVAARAELDTVVTLCRTVGWRFEDKGESLTVHFRHAASPEQTARQMRAQMATVLDPRRLVISDARAALEIRPAGARTKADAVRLLLDAAGGAASCVMVGDDRTDLDAFTHLEDADVQAIRVAVASSEMPPELAAGADLVLDSQADVASWLAQLLDS